MPVTHLYFFIFHMVWNVSGMTHNQKIQTAYPYGSNVCLVSVIFSHSVKYIWYEEGVYVYPQIAYIIVAMLLILYTIYKRCITQEPTAKAATCFYTI